MTIKEQIQKRQESNLKIADILKGTQLEAKYQVGTRLTELANQFPQQRAGQLITNYIVPEYRFAPTNATREILEALFPGDPDPFFEESVVTLERFKSNPKSK